MEKRGSRYLRYAIFNATKYVCLWDPNFAAYLAKKRAEGKHYNVAISHAAKKLVRLICAMEHTGLSLPNSTHNLFQSAVRDVNFGSRATLARTFSHTLSGK